MSSQLALGWPVVRAVVVVLAVGVVGLAIVAGLAVVAAGESLDVVIAS